MGKPEFTAGPWTFEPGVNEYGHQQDFAPILGTVRGSGGKPDGGEHIAVCVSDLAEAEANARLIAAAPELYEAVRLFVEEYDASDDAAGIGMMLAYNNALAAAKSALAKARGETA